MQIAKTEHKKYFRFHKTDFQNQTSLFKGKGHKTKESLTTGQKEAREDYKELVK